jgi:hypothetical protein
MLHILPQPVHAIYARLIKATVSLAHIKRRKMAIVACIRIKQFSMKVLRQRHRPGLYDGIARLEYHLQNPRHWKYARLLLKRLANPVRILPRSTATVAITKVKLAISKLPVLHLELFLRMLNHRLDLPVYQLIMSCARLIKATASLALIRQK